MTDASLTTMIVNAIAAREPLFDVRHESAMRLFNGFYEGNPELVIDLYADTVIIHNYTVPSEAGIPLVKTALETLKDRLPWLRCAILKTRNGATAEEKNGVLLFGDAPARKIKEHGVWYSVDLRLNRDAGLYLDTRSLRQWLTQKMGGKTVLNTFAYTGSLGVAAEAGKAVKVIQLDLKRDFLNQAKTSYSLNGFPIDKKKFIAGDFWTKISRLNHDGERFDCVILDPPFFATNATGTVDQVNNCARLINKVRPLINDGGVLIAINNALFVSGKDYFDTLEKLCADGYLEIIELISVPPDFTGYTETRVGTPVTDPAPFNHSTKIAIMAVRRKPENA